MTNVWKFVKKHKILCSKIYLEIYSTIGEISHIKLQVWDERSFDPFNYRMGKFNTLSNSCSSEAVLDNFRLFTEIYSNTSKIYCEYSSSSYVLTAAGHIPLTSCLLISSVNQALYLLEINDLAGLLTVSSRGWNLFVRLHGMIKTWQKFSLQKSIITLLSCPFNDACSLE